MNIIHIRQKSREWVELRKAFNTASEAPVAAGESKYKTRADLIKEKHSGLPEEIGFHKQALFDKGHAAEEAARDIAEKILGNGLYPITATLEIDGIKLLASMDGATMDEETIWEHKLYSESLANDVRAGTLGAHYTIQMDQQLLVSGAKKCLFMTSDGTENNVAWCWYESTQEKFDAVVNIWRQFNSDLAAYVPVVHPEKPEAEAVMQLPSLSIQTSGQISIISNLELFGQKLNEFVDGLDLEPTDDQGFANCEAAVKTLQKAQDALEAAEASALAQAADVDEMRRTVALYADTARKTRIMLEKMVKARKEQIKVAALTKTRKAFADHLASLDAEIKPIRMLLQEPPFIEAAKNKRTLASLYDALDTALANAKIVANDIAAGFRVKLAWYKENAGGYEFLFPDMQQIIFKEVDDFQMLVQSRIKQRKENDAAHLEAERARIQLEEEAKARAKAEAEVRAQAAAEAQAKALAERNARVEADRVAKVAEAQAMPAPAAAIPLKPAPANPSPSVNPALVALARHEAVCFRKKYAPIKELVGVMAEIDLYLAATADQRQTVEA